VPDGWTAYTGVNDVQAVAWDAGGYLWAATTHGVVRWDPASDTATRYGAADGLPSGPINDVAAAPDGSVWVAASGGVSRFDGARWTTYTRADGLPSDGLLAVAVAPDGTVWVGASNGIAAWDGASWTHHHNGPAAWDLDVAPDGQVWAAFGASGLGHYVPAQDAWTILTSAPGVQSLNVQAVAVGPGGELWVAVLWDGVYRTEGAEWQKIGDPGGMVCGLAVAADGIPWIATCGSLHYSAGSVRSLAGREWVDRTAGDGLGEPAVRAVALGPTGQVAAGTETGLKLRQAGIWRMLRSGPVRNSVTAVAVELDGAVWLGYGDGSSDAAGGGVSRFDGRQWDHSLGDANVQALALAADGSLWAGTGCSVQRLDGQTWRQMAGCDQVHGNVVDLAAAPDGAVWVAALMGLGWLDGQSWTPFDRLVHSVAVGPDGTVWVAGWEGTPSSWYVARRDGGEWTTYNTVDAFGGSLASLAVTADGALWGMAGQKGLARFDGRAWTFQMVVDGLPLNSGGVVAVAPDGTLWVGTLGGLARWDGLRWQAYPSPNGVAAVAFAPDGMLWLGTTDGLVRFQPAEP
jgi:ligand-binding sensor domain-containing protein